MFVEKRTDRHQRHHRHLALCFSGLEDYARLRGLVARRPSSATSSVLKTQGDATDDIRVTRTSRLSSPRNFLSLCLNLERHPDGDSGDADAITLPDASKVSSSCCSPNPSSAALDLILQLARALARQAAREDDAVEHEES